VLPRQSKVSANAQLPRIVTPVVASEHRTFPPVQPRCYTRLSKQRCIFFLPPVTPLANHVSKIYILQDSRSKLYVNDTVSISANKSRGKPKNMLDSIYSPSGSHILTSTHFRGYHNIHAQRAYFLFRRGDYRVYSAIDIFSSQIRCDEHLTAKPTLKRSECIASYDDEVCYGIPTDATGTICTARTSLTDSQQIKGTPWFG
jgi:hypothetical protein